MVYPFLSEELLINGMQLLRWCGTR